MAKIRKKGSGNEPDPDPVISLVLGNDVDIELIVGDTKFVFQGVLLKIDPEMSRDAEGVISGVVKLTFSTISGLQRGK